MEYCNVCEKNVEDPKEHVESKEHKDNLFNLQHIFNAKVYDDKIGIKP